MEDLEEAWRVFMLMEATKWHFLPYTGGLLDQPEILMTNVFRIADNVRRLQEAK